MMNRTDRHFRFLMRLITRHTWLYTEMVVARALVHGEPARLLRRDASEHPVALQVGGSEPQVLARAATLAAEYRYDEINLNVGCPSPRVTKGGMGACLMGEPTLVAECVAAMDAAGSGLPVTIKTRLGIDEHDDFGFLCRLVQAVAEAGCRTIIVHARKAWLNGLDPRANRTVPPLDYERVRALKARYPTLEIVVNGGIADLDAAEKVAEGVDGVMLGRAAYAEPMRFAEADARFFGDPRPPASVTDVAACYLEYLRTCAGEGVALGPALRHLPAVVSGVRGARAVRRQIGALAGRADIRGIEQALAPVLSARAA